MHISLIPFNVVLRIPISNVTILICLGLAGDAVCAILEGGYFPPSLAEGAALTLRTLLGDPPPLLPSVIKAANKEMELSIKNVQISLSPYLKVFQMHQEDVIVENAWQGPSTSDLPPFDIMCPTPPRGEAEENRFKDIVAKLVEQTNLHVPYQKLVVSAKGKLTGQKENIAVEDAVDQVLNGSALIGVIDHYTKIRSRTERNYSV